MILRIGEPEFGSSSHKVFEHTFMSKRHHLTLACSLGVGNIASWATAPRCAIASICIYTLVDVCFDSEEDVRDVKQILEGSMEPEARAIKLFAKAKERWTTEHMLEIMERLSEVSFEEGKLTKQREILNVLGVR